MLTDVRNAALHQNLKAMFDAIAPTSAASTSDPLEVYLASPPNPAVSDPLAHWNALLGSKSDAPLARFALDYLSVPGESSDAGLPIYS